MSTTDHLYPVIALPVESLIPLPTNPFDLYEGQRLEDLVESVQTNGVLVPIIVRPTGGDLYEILAGHNRVEASKILGLETVPAIVRDDLTDAEAMFVAIANIFFALHYSTIHRPFLREPSRYRSPAV